MQGVDISKYQKNLTLKQIKNAGHQFAILRGGYTTYGNDRTKKKDEMFEKFYQQSREIAFPVGAYYYSCATNRIEGENEAKFFHENCLKGKKFEYPVYIDVEDIHWQYGKKTGVTDAIIGFCEYLEEKGFYVGVYASLSFFNHQIDTSRLHDYTKWVASWSNRKPTPQFNGFGMWQNSGNGKIDKYYVDTDQAFIDFPSIMKKVGKNGYVAQKVTTSRIHIVNAGETLTKIAKMNNTTVDAIVKKNGIKDKNKIYVGQKLKI